MFNLGPMEMLVLAIVGLVVIGPEKLPGMAKDAARMLRTLRELATGARSQLQDELGPEFADVDLRNLNPRTAVKRMVFGDDAPSFDPRSAVRDAIFGDDGLDDLRAADPRADLRGVRASYYDADVEAPPTARVNGAANGHGRVDLGKPSALRDPAARPRPRPRPTRDDDDIT